MTDLRWREASSTGRAVGQHDRPLRRAALAGRGGVRHAPVPVEEDVSDGLIDSWSGPIRAARRTR